MIDNTLMHNEGLSLRQLFRKRDCIRQLIDLGYDLEPELIKVNEYLKKESEKQESYLI